MQIIKKHKIITSIYLTFTLLVVLLSIIKVPYDITSPGYVNEVESVIEVDGALDYKGTFNTVSVYSYERISVLQYILALFDRKTTISRTYEQLNLSNVEQKASGLIQKNVSLVNSLIIGYETAKEYGVDCSIKYHLEGFIIDRIYNYLTPNTLEIGDIIVSINGLSLKDNIYEEVINEIGVVNSYTLEVLRKEEIKTFQITKNEYINYNGNISYGFGFNGYDYFIIDEANPSYSLNKSSTYGPSGGLLQSLQVFSALYKECDLTNNLKIVGTGTIDYLGNVGEIGGMYQKVLCADINNADVFFAPAYRRRGYDYSFIKISNDNTWMINDYDTKIIASKDNIPYIKNGIWFIDDVDTRYSAYGSILTFYDETTLKDETNFLEGYRSYSTLKNTKMAYVPVSTLTEAINYLFTIKNKIDVLKNTQNAYKLYLKNNEDLSINEWMEMIKR